MRSFGFSELERQFKLLRQLDERKWERREGTTFPQRCGFTFRNWKGISNSIVSLPNLSKRCEGATVPAVAALTLPRPAQEKGKDGLFSSLLRISLLFLMVPASWKAKRVLQDREIRRIGFSVAFSYPLRLSTELKKRQRQILKARLKEQPCFVKFNLRNSLIQKYS